MVEARKVESVPLVVDHTAQTGRVGAFIDTSDALAGRAAEFAALDRALERARAGHPQVVHIDGEPGVGKTVLLESFLARQHDTAVVRWVRCDEFEQSIALGVAGLLLDDSSLARWSGVAAGRRLLSWLSELQTGRHRLVIVAIDDAQWMDRASAQALRFALRRLRADRVLCLLARRPAPDGEALALTDDPAATTVLRPGQLRVDEVNALARRLRSWQLPADVTQRLVTRTGGMPLLVAAVLKGAHDVRQLASDTDVVPSAAAAASAMLASVDTSARALVEAAAVLAEPSDLIALGTIAEVPEPASALAVATAAGLVRVENNTLIDCAHALLREAIYRTLPFLRRRDLHTRAAEWTTGDRRLAHRVAAADRPDPQLVDDLLDAAAHARVAGEFGVAAQHRLRARRVCADPAQREQLLLTALIERVEAQDLEGGQELAQLAGASSSGALRSLALGLLARETGDIGPARSRLREAQTLATAAGDRRTHDRAAVAAGVLDVRLGDGAAAIDVLADVRPVDDPELATDTLTTRALGLWFAGELQRGLDVISATSLSRQGTGWEAELVAVRGMIRMYLGQLQPALDDLDLAVRFAHLWRPSTNQSRIYLLRAMTRYHLGDWDGASVDTAAARALAQDSAQLWSAPLALSLSVSVPANRGQWEVARDYLVGAKKAAADIASPAVADVVLSQEIALAVAQEDHAAVLASLAPVWSRSFLDRLVPNRSVRDVMQARIPALIAAGQLRQAETDLDLYQNMVGEFPEGPIPSRLGWLRGQLAEARSEPRQARQHYANDLADPREREVPFLFAQLLYTSGKLERALGSRRKAIAHLTDAWDIFTRLRAAPFLARCSAELSACGLRSPVADSLALTPREEDVTSLVLRGFSNKQVAAELFLTTKTVEYHLSNAYAKLGVDNRHQLRQLRADRRDVSN